MDEGQTDTFGRTLMNASIVNRRRTRQFFSFRDQIPDEPIEYEKSFESAFIFLTKLSIFMT